MSRVKLVSVTPVKNDMWILPTWFERHVGCVDAMVVLDDGSTDGTLEYVRSRREVTTLLTNPPGRPWRVFENYNRMLDVARFLGATWIIVLDSDDLLDARFADARDALLKASGVRRYHFREISLWRSSQMYRADQPEKYSRARNTPPFLVRATPSLRYTPPHLASLGKWIEAALRNPRVIFDRSFIPKGGVLAGLAPGSEVDLDLVHLHYHFADREIAWRKHMIYALYEAIQFRKRPGEIHEVVGWATARLDEAGIVLKPVDPIWGALPLPNEAGPHAAEMRRAAGS